MGVADEYERIMLDAAWNHVATGLPGHGGRFAERKRKKPAIQGIAYHEAFRMKPPQGRSDKGRVEMWRGSV
jgi:hypothetical protein